jgi:signal transduction histidine kinase
VSEDQPLYLIVEMTHVLARECDALDKIIKETLLGNGDGDTPTSMRRRRRRSFYRDFEWRVGAGLLTAPKTISALRRILRQTDHFRIQVHNLLGSVSQDQSLSLNREQIDLEALLQEVIDLFEYSALEKGIEIRSQVVGRPSIFADRDLLYRMFVNLTDNAIKYSYSKSEASGERFITIDCHRYSMHNDWLVEYKSYGVGIDPEEISTGYIFQYGKRGKFSEDRGRPGTGIGLAEAKRIAEAHRGTIKVESAKLDGGNYLTSVKVIIRDQR